VTDEEFLKPSREYLAYISALIKKAEVETREAVERHGKYDKEHARRLWSEFYQRVLPLEREREAVMKVITDYYGLKPKPFSVIVFAQ